uniref:Uncharacterized protein n=1 Tax=Glossina brevipalpis TaxID=37001 RepID=A0A1A9W618_9MUSC
MIQEERSMLLVKAHNLLHYSILSTACDEYNIHPMIIIESCSHVLHFRYTCTVKHSRVSLFFLCETIKQHKIFTADRKEKNKKIKTTVTTVRRHLNILNANSVFVSSLNRQFKYCISMSLLVQQWCSVHSNDGAGWGWLMVNGKARQVSILTGDLLNPLE